MVDLLLDSIFVVPFAVADKFHALICTIHVDRGLFFAVLRVYFDVDILKKVLIRGLLFLVYRGGRAVDGDRLDLQKDYRIVCFRFENITRFQIADRIVDVGKHIFASVFIVELQSIVRFVRRFHGAFYQHGKVFVLVVVKIEHDVIFEIVHGLAVKFFKALCVLDVRIVHAKRGIVVIQQKSFEQKILRYNGNFDIDRGCSCVRSNLLHTAAEHLAAFFCVQRNNQCTGSIIVETDCRRFAVERHVRDGIRRSGIRRTVFDHIGKQRANLVCTVKLVLCTDGRRF